VFHGILGSLGEFETAPRIAAFCWVGGHYLLAINGNEQPRGIIFSTELPRFPVLALPLVLLPLVGSVMYPDSIGIKECLAAFAVCGVGDFVIEWYYVDHANK
jgi:hypothetical protein